MKLTLKREIATSNSITGSLFVNGVFECFTLEDIQRPAKIAGETSIPAGKYKVIFTFSNRFGFELPLLLNVPGFDGVRIHSGNTSKDTEGCILVGKQRSKDYISNSRIAYAALAVKIKAALAKKEVVEIEVINIGATQ